MAAEHMLYGSLAVRINSYNTSTFIRDGQSLFDWANGDTMSKYALSYLFVQYLRTQSGGGTTIYKSIIQSSNRTATVVQDVMQHFYSTITLDDIQKNFRIATVLKEDTGAQGFMGESAFNTVAPQLYTGSGMNLKGGGAVIKAISSPVTPTGYGSNIKFVGFRWDKVATPVASVASGTVASGTNVTLSCATIGATIYYTTDGSTPTSSSKYYNYPITITANTTINAIAYKNRMSNSDVVTLAYIALPRVSDPFASPNSGIVATGSTIMLGTTTDSATIRYTTDGSIPTVTVGTLYTTPIVLTENTTIKVIAYKEGMFESNIMSFSYTVFEKVASPRSNIAAGFVLQGTMISLSCDTSDSTIRYTLDGSTPTATTGKVYSNPIIITSNTTVKAMAYKYGIFDSDISEFTYKILPTEIMKKKIFGASGFDYFNSVTAANDGYIAVGYSDVFGNGDWTDVTGKGTTDAIIVKYDTSYNVVWKKNFGGSSGDNYNSVTAVNDGYIAVGYSDSFSNGDLTDITGKGYTDAIIVKYDLSGNVVWKKNFGGSMYECYKSVTAVNDGYIAVGYSFASSFGNGDWTNVVGKGAYDAIIVKYDTNGNVTWKKNFGGSSNDFYYSVTAVNNGYIAAGYSSAFGNGDWAGVTGKGGNDAIIVKYDTNGNVVWEKNFGGSGSDHYNSVASVKDGFIVVGYSDVYSFGNGDWIGVSGKGLCDAVVVKYDTSGNAVCKKNFGGSNNDYYNSVTVVNDGYVGVGYSNSTFLGDGDLTGIYGKGACDAIIVKYKYVSINLLEPLYNNSYGIYSDTAQLNLFPQSSGTYTVKAQYINTTGKSISTSFIITVKSDNKLLKTYIIPSQNIAIDGVVDISKDIELPSAATTPNLEVKLMALDSLSVLAPLAVGISMGR